MKTTIKIRVPTLVQENDYFFQDLKVFVRNWFISDKFYSKIEIIIEKEG